MNHYEKILSLYENVSKHSHYQRLASNFETIFPADKLPTYSRYEKERLACICETLDFSGKRVLDIGGNTGFFSFEALNKGAASVDFYEGNPVHAAFVEASAALFSMKDRLRVYSLYYEFGKEEKQNYDIIFLLNVLHHLGDDYGEKNVSKEQVKTRILAQLNAMARHAKYIVFQMGFNWKGDPDLCLFEYGTKREMIRYIQAGTDRYWKICSLAIAERDAQGQVFYRPCTASNMERDDSLGEFLNRPLFILERRLQ